MKLKNPFITEGYAGRDYFCDREDEAAEMLTALAAGRNITLISPRRMGKTGLIKRVFEEAQARGVKCFYIDILNTRTLNDFIQLFANALLGGFDGPLTAAFNALTKVFKSCRPTLTADATTGMPTLSLDIQKGEEIHTLKEVFDYIGAKKQECYVAIDEFQQVAEYPETNTEALLRSYIQFVPNITFVFSGSKKHLMQEMFASPKRPFYQSAQTLSLKAIDQARYADFAALWFSRDNRELPRECFDRIYSTVMAHTWYIQYWLSMLYDYSAGTVSLDAVDEVLARILRMEEDNFLQYMRLMNKTQQRIAVAIAKEGAVGQPLAKEFLQRHALPAASTVSSALRTMLESDILMEEQGVYSVYNRFFMLWLRRL